MIAPCQRNIDITLHFFYNIFEVIDMAMKPGTKTITFRISEDLYSQIIKEAADEERSINNFITYVVKEYIKNKCLDAKK